MSLIKLVKEQDTHTHTHGGIVGDTYSDAVSNCSSNGSHVSMYLCICICALYTLGNPRLIFPFSSFTWDSLIFASFRLVCLFFNRRFFSVCWQSSTLTRLQLQLDRFLFSFFFGMVMGIELKVHVRVQCTANESGAFCVFIYIYLYYFFYLFRRHFRLNELVAFGAQCSVFSV